MKNSLFVMVMIIIPIMAACSGATATPGTIETVPAEFAGQTNPYGVEAAPLGEEVYKAYCVSCHGETGLGDGVAGASLFPPPKNLVQLQSVVEDDYLFWRISTGRAGTAMVGWRGVLTDQQIWQVVSFIRTLK